MLRSILGPSRSDEEIEAALAVHGYDLSATIMAFMDGQPVDPAAAQAQATENKSAILIGKSMTPDVARPVTPANQQRSGVVCRFWLSTGQCLRADCRFSHDLSNHICKYWVMGNCLAGDTCIFSHDPSHFMNRLALDGSSTPPLQNVQPNFQFQDYNAYPALGAGQEQWPNSYQSGSSFNNYPQASRHRPVSKHCRAITVTPRARDRDPIADIKLEIRLQLLPPWMIQKLSLFECRCRQGG